ncbi:MAG: exonuclease SbcCD subunit D [Candidatus Methanomethylophilaceae archaeon]|nr:exonuclease SbcCD subunit D [Sphaerochaetaceae bacterium]MDD3987293.1 exonuclease SbcCD subunit D [Candidatus Methanomethylophilaceae archaeon]MDD4709524.1 exonuclease SbcCD subunit D [Candidatus Methanomethylophilaceae archaeon]MDY0246906.1 exonuclease SbcCD subunit D [Methanosarcina mazei]
MKFIHIADLHIGKKLKEMNLEEDQRFILKQIVAIARDENADAVLIAGDVYDSGSPNGESSLLLDEFLTELLGSGIEIFMISGNHDSPEKLSFGSRIFDRAGLHICSIFDGKLDKFTLEKNNGSVDVFMLPFIRPVNVSRIYRDEKISSFGDAVGSAISHTDLSGNNKKILITHQFVSGTSSPQMSDSESAYVGTAEMMPYDLFDRFDYVALGHLHIPQSVGRETIRYSGSPLKYSTSECSKDKSVTLIEVGDDVNVTEVPLKPLRDLKVIKGPLDRLLAEGKRSENKEDFYHVRLEDDPLDPMQKLRDVYPNVISLEILSKGDGDVGEIDEEYFEKIDVEERFNEFFRSRMSGKEMSEEQKEAVRDSMREAGLI